MSIIRLNRPEPLNHLVMREIVETMNTEGTPIISPSQKGDTLLPKCCLTYQESGKCIRDGQKHIACILHRIYMDELHDAVAAAIQLHENNLLRTILDFCPLGYPASFIDDIDRSDNREAALILFNRIEPEDLTDYVDKIFKRLGI